MGVLRFGGLMFGAMTTWALLSPTTRPHQLLDYVFEIALNGLIWPLAGYLWGLWIWKSYETRLAQTDARTSADRP